MRLNRQWGKMIKKSHDCELGTYKLEMKLYNVRLELQFLSHLFQKVDGSCEKSNFHILEPLMIYQARALE